MRIRKTTKTYLDLILKNIEIQKTYLKINKYKKQLNDVFKFLKNVFNNNF